MYWILFFIIIITYIEIFLFIQISHIFGLLLTVLLVMTTSLIGLLLAREQGLCILEKIQMKLACKKHPIHEMMTGTSLLLASVLLIIPGFFTDFLGLILLLSPIQNLLTLRLLLYLRVKQGMGTRGKIFEGEYSRHDLPNDK